MIKFRELAKVKYQMRLYECLALWSEREKMKSREIEHIEIQNRLRGSVLIQEREYHIYIYIG